MQCVNDAMYNHNSVILSGHSIYNFAACGYSFTIKKI
jgi:hypothetical protein